jgi:hypothetical protein
MPETVSATDGPRFLRRADAARYVREKWGIPCAARTLAKLACGGGGPEMRYAGRVPLYELEALDKWAAERIGPVRRSTSDRDPQGSKRDLGPAAGSKAA